jgi:putative flippase GtrA
MLAGAEMKPPWAGAASSSGKRGWTSTAMIWFPLRSSPSFFRFLLVGALNSLFGYGCFALLLYLGVHYAMALFLATVIGVLFNFKTTGYLVFKSKDNRLILRFATTYAIVYAVNVTTLKVLSLVGVDMYLGGALLLLPMAILAFFLNKAFVFNDG